MNIVERLANFANKFSSESEFIIGFIVCAIIFFTCYFLFMKFVVDHGSKELVAIFILIVILSGVVVSLVDNMNPAIFLLMPALFIVIIFIIYSVELKTIVWARKNGKYGEYKHKDSKNYDKEKIDKCINEIIKALQNMSKNDVGAIIVLANGNVPTQIIDSGVKLDSDISSELIESVFFPKTPLHDGAMIIDETQIVAAGCFLPLSQNISSIPKDFGSRHRAGLGVTETLDVISLIVSEETGVISIARAGKITRYADYEMLKNVLSKYYWEELENFKR